MRRFWPRSILARTTLILLISAGLTGALFIVLASAVIADRAQHQVHAQLSGLIETVERTVSIACYLTDKPLAAEVAQGLLKNREVASVVILAADHNELTRLSRADSQAPNDDLDNDHAIHRMIVSPFDQDSVVGELILIPDPQEIARHIDRNVDFVRILLILELTVLSGVVVLMVLLMVIRPIRLVSNRLHAMDASAGDKLIPPSGHSDDEIGQLVGDVNVLADHLVSTLHEEKAIRLQREAGEKKYHAIFDNAEAGICQLDAAGRVISHNPAFVRMTGMNLGATEKNGPLLTELPCSDPAKLTDALNRCQQTGLTVTETLQLHGRPAGSLWLHLILTPIDQGLVQGVISDITEFTLAKQAAETASQGKSTFLANMSHEIRTPMNGVLGMLEILSHSSLSGEELKMVEMSRRSASSLLGILNDILDFSKIEAGKLSLSEEKMSLESELEIVVNLIDRIALDKQVEFSIFFDPTIPQNIIADGLRVRQILTNLAGNAVKFSAEMDRIGRIHLRVERGSCVDDRIWVTFTIADNGVGMNAETVARLFQPFEQADSSTTRRYGGTGLGLVISKSLVSMMSGEIAVQSKAGEGTVFTVRLPFKLASECPNLLSPYDLSGVAFFVVGDEAQYVDDYTRYLEHAGAQVQRFSDFDAACDRIIDHAQETPVCVILMEDPGLQSAQDIVDRLQAKLQSDNVHFVNVACMRVQRGKRRKVRRLSDRVFQIDREAMTRLRFLEAAAIAIGRNLLYQDNDADENFDPKTVLETGFNILVAEDNDVNRDVIRRQLEMLGYRVDIEIDGQKAFDRWQAGRYDLLITDLHMPNKDGYELTALIRETESRANLSRIPIIALTANALKGEEENCLNQGMDAYLSKPIELSRLKSVLNQWLPKETPNNVILLKEDINPYEVADIPQLPVFDPETLSKMLGDNPDIHKRLLEKFLTSSHEQTRELLQSVKLNDAAAVGQIAHKLKSAARSVGAIRLGELCEKLEFAGKAGDVEDCLVISESLNTAFTECDKAIVKYLNSQS